MKKNLVTGFTLLELMMTVGILGILSIITVPFLVNIYVAQVEQAAATQVLSIFKTARQQAIAMRTNVSIALVSGEWRVTNASDNSVVTQQKLTSTFKSSLAGIKTSTTSVTAASSFGYTSAGVPYVNGAFLSGTQSIFIAFSRSQLAPLSIADSRTIGLIVDATGSIYICKNTVDGQVTQKCNT